MEDRYGTRRCKICEGLMDLPEGEYCSYCKPKDKTETKPKTKQQKLKEKYPDDRKYIEILCTGQCGKVMNMRVGDPSIYTAEVRAKWKCMLCSQNNGEKKRGWDLGLNK